MREIKTTDCRDCFYIPGKPGIIDLVHPTTGRSVFAKQNLAEMQERDSAIVIGDFDTVVAEQAGYWKRPPTPTTRGEFFEQLGCLPPERWKSGPEWEVFYCAEHTSGTVTRIYVRLGPDDDSARYFVLSDEMTLPVKAAVDACRAYAGTA